MRRSSLVAALVVALAMAACGGGEERGSTTGGFTSVAADTLTVATNLPAPGFWNGDDPGAITGGYEYGIAQELARRIGLSKGVRVQNVSFDALVAGQARGFDLALSQVTITDERRRVVDFSEPYFSSDQGILVNRGTALTDAAAARQLQWGVQQSTTGQAFLDNTLRPAKSPRVYGETTQAFTALQARQVDAVLLDTAIVLGQASQPNSPFEVVGQFRSGEAYGAVLPKGSRNLAVVDRHIRDMAADGTLARLSGQYLTPEFGADPARVPYIAVS